MGENEDTILKAPRDCRETGAAQPLYPPPPLSSPIPFPSLLISGPICLQTACKGATLPGPDGGCCEISPSIQTKNLLSPPPRADLRAKKFPWVSCSQLDVACSRTQNLLWGARRAGVEQSSCTARPCPRSVLLQYTLTKIESHFISIQQQRKRNPPPPKKKPVFCTVSIADIVKLAIYSYSSQG